MGDRIYPGYLTKVFTVAAEDLEEGATVLEAGDVPAGKAPVVVAYVLMGKDETDVVFTGTDDAVCSPTYYLSPAGGVHSPVNVNGWWKRQGAGVGIKVTGSAAADISGVLCYFFEGV